MSLRILAAYAFFSLWVAGFPTLVVAGSRGLRDFPVWGGVVRLPLPDLARDPEEITEKIYSVSPPANRPDLKYVIYVIREPLRADEKDLSNENLEEAIKGMLQMSGYQIISLTHTDNTFLADFRAIIAPGPLPWQKVGPGIARGKAKFVRINGELIGSVLLCDPSQWKSKTTQSFIDVVGGTIVAQ